MTDNEERADSLIGSKRTFTDTIDSIFCFLGGSVLTAIYSVRAHNPLSRTGRRQIKTTVLRSGPAYRSSQSPNARRETPARLDGWRMGVFLSIVLLSMCLIAEVIMLVLASTIAKSPFAAMYNGILVEGECDMVRRWSATLAIFLNVVGTLIIGASNYMLQCVSSPSEEEIRDSHQRGKSVMLGVVLPLSKNLSSKKMMLWWVLAVTSLPVHLLLNSAFFTSTQANNYGIAVVTADYKQTDLWSTCSDITVGGKPDSQSWTSFACSLVQSSWTDEHFERLENEQCIQRYSNRLLTHYSNIILVSNSSSDRRVPPTRPDNSTSNNLGFTLGRRPYYDPGQPRLETKISSEAIDEKLLRLPGLFAIFTSFEYKAWEMSFTLDNGLSRTFDPASWICNQPRSTLKKRQASTGNDPTTIVRICTPDAAKFNASSWMVSPESIPISHCLSQKLSMPGCQVEVSSLIILVIFLCDIMKLGIALILLLSLQESLCVTFGDAIQSFLSQPDPITENHCLLDDHPGIRPAVNGIREQNSIKDKPRKIRWIPYSWLRWHAITKRQRGIMFMSFLLAAGGGWYLISLGRTQLLSAGVKHMWKAGFWSVDANAVFTNRPFWDYRGKSGFLLQVIVVNLPQLFFSYLYFFCNSVFTAMHSAKEWSGFATQRKTLRVSTPRGEQRSTYWLNLPWSFSLPLLVLSGVLHWLISRSVYLVRINTIGPDGTRQPSQNLTACGFSTLMMAFSLGGLSVLGIFVFIFGCREVTAQIVFVGTDSLALSAACHHRNDQETEALKPLKWGVTETPQHGQPGHCSLSSSEVSVPVSLEFYS